MVEGKLQIEGEVIHVIVERCFNISKLLTGLVAAGKQDFSAMPTSRADEKSAPIVSKKQTQRDELYAQKKIFPEGRNFR
jgi:error-prone DNA polymerase